MHYRLKTFITVKTLIAFPNKFARKAQWDRQHMVALISTLSRVEQLHSDLGEEAEIIFFHMHIE